MHPHSCYDVNTWSDELGTHIVYTDMQEDVYMANSLYCDCSVAFYPNLANGFAHQMHDCD